MGRERPQLTHPGILRMRRVLRVLSLLCHLSRVELLLGIRVVARIDVLTWLAVLLCRGDLVVSE